MLTKQQALDEAQKQKDALAVIARWRRNLFICASLFLVIAVYGLSQGGSVFALGVCGVILTVICVIAMFVVNLSIRNGRRNVERILQSLQSAQP